MFFRNRKMQHELPVTMMSSSKEPAMNHAIAAALCGLATLIMVTGCQTNKVRQDHLWTENRALRSELDRAIATRDQAENERNRLANEVRILQSQLNEAQSALAQSRPTNANANTAASIEGFTGMQGVEAEVRNGNIFVRIEGDVLFDSGRAVLKESAKRTLNQIAGVIRSKYPTNQIRIEGYTDTDPIRRSSWADNLELSLQRAAAVFRYLQSQGMDPKQMYASGFGEHRPRDTKARSRRVEIVVVQRDQ